VGDGDDMACSVAGHQACCAAQNSIGEDNNRNGRASKIWRGMKRAGDCSAAYPA
jgi:hypothetical protein